MFIKIDEHDNVCVYNNGFIEVDGVLDWENDNIVLSSN